MRPFFFYIAFCAFTTSAFAQAADKDAIDLSAKMDTIARETQTPLYVPDAFRNVGLQNPDQWEDFELSSYRSLFAAQDSSWLHYGGIPLIFGNPTNAVIADVPVLYGDFDGDGVGDIIGSVWQAFYKGRKTYPYFDTTYTSRFAAADKFAQIGFFSSMDFNEDGTHDVLAGGDGYLRFYKGGISFGETKFMFADDSIKFPIAGTTGGVIAGKFSPHLKPMILWSDGNYTYLLKQNGITFSQDSIILISNGTTNGIVVTNLYATDITGDDITDLIVSDGIHIYIFKGGDDFGTYQLTPQNAFYTIKSPRLTDDTHFGFVDDFGSHLLRNCGDLTGSGIPYLMVGGDQSGSGLFKAYGFLYAGGKALDSLYDGIIGFVNNGFWLQTDTLHSINSTGRTVSLLTDDEDENYNLRNLDFLMSRGCDSIPHKTNPQMVNVIYKITEGFEAICFPAIANKFTKVQISSNKFSEAKVTIFNLLGQSIQKRLIQLDPGENTEFFDTSEWTSGTYIIEMETSSGIATAKMIVSH